MRPGSIGLTGGKSPDGEPFARMEMPARYVIETSNATSRLIAAVQARVAYDAIAQQFRSSLDKVWAFLRTHPGLRTDGHNLFLYHHEGPGSDFATVDFGVEVVRPFEAEGDVRCVDTPAGEVASTVHIGPYDGLPQAHAALHDWCRRNDRRIGGFSWEIYGDWADDPNELETIIVYLLEP